MLTKCDNNRCKNSQPECCVRAEHYDFIHEIAALEERVNYDPYKHDEGRSNDDDPCEKGPAVQRGLATTITTIGGPLTSVCSSQRMYSQQIWRRQPP